MERGLLWFPLLIAFFWLAWQGAQEYQKVEAYRVWAEQFERAKYDIYSVLGQKADKLTWGKPTTKGIIKEETFSLLDVETIQLLINHQAVDITNPPQKGRNIELKFIWKEPGKIVIIPFTEIPLASEWGKFLQKLLQNLQSSEMNN